jgi:hypothetical protein
MTTIPCPFCNSPIPIDSTICVRCGKQGGERLERVRNAVIEEEAKAAEEKANARSEIERQNHDREMRRKIGKARLSKVWHFLRSSRGKWISIFVFVAVVVVGTPQVLRQPLVLLNLCGTNGITSTEGVSSSQFRSGIGYFEARFSTSSEARAFRQCIRAWSGILGVDANLTYGDKPAVGVRIP